MSMWIGGLVLIREVMLLANTDKWRLDVFCTEDEKGHLSVIKRFLCDNETGERWELKSFGLHNGEQAAMIVSVEKEEIRDE